MNLIRRRKPVKSQLQPQIVTDPGQIPVPQTAAEFLRRGYAYYSRRMYTQAIQDYQAAIASDPEMIDAVYALGMAFKAEKQNEKSVRTFHQVLDLLNAGAVGDRIRADMLRRLALGHINEITPVDDQNPDSLAEAILDFQNSYDFDLVKITPASSYCLKDWNVMDEWGGHTEGTRLYTREVIFKPEDWQRLPILDPKKGKLGEMLACLERLVRELGPETPALQTIFNPLAQAKNLAGGDRLLVHMHQHPEALHTGLHTIAESTRNFIEAARHTGIAGLFYAVQHAQYSLLSETEYEIFGHTYDHAVLEGLDKMPELWLNMLHLHGEHVMFDSFLDYPFQIINWHDRDTPPSLPEAAVRSSALLCGGLRRELTMVLGTPDQVQDEAHDAIKSTGGKRFILGTGCVLPIIAPRANILAARRSVESLAD
jgi:uroporphyrinogen decarboxylase